jgi:hypothetical protein
MAKVKDRFDAIGVRVIVVGFEPAETLARLRMELTSPFEFVADPERRLYGALGLRRATFTRT